MSLRDIKIKLSYKSKGDNIADEFLNPAFECSKVYKRSVGFFSSSVYDLISFGMKKLVDNDGHIYLLCSPELSNNDIEAIKLGIKLKKETLEKNFYEDLENSLREIEEENLRLLVSLIKNSVLEVAIAEIDGDGIYHDKIGLIEDYDGNKVLFIGSSNESKYGYLRNYEKIRISKSWVESDKERIEDDEKEFDEIWSGLNPYVKKVDANAAIVKSIIKIAKEKDISLDIEETTDDDNGSGIKLRSYQTEAIEKWKANGNRGFWVMATGTGKTWTAIYASLEASKDKDIFLVVCAPYKHLIKQWCNDLEKVYKNNYIVMISSENPRWENELKDALLNSKYNGGGTVIAVSTIKSFYSERFTNILKKNKMDKMLIVDEAHRFKNLSAENQIYFQYMLGLSATPASRMGDEFADKLLNYFGGEVYSLPIEFAIEKNYLVHYNYYPIFVDATDDEEKEFERLTKSMMGCFKGGILEDPERLATLKRSRLRVISMAEEKMNRLTEFLDVMNSNDHFIIYCGDGRLFEAERNDEVRHIQYVADRLTAYGKKVSKFTADEKMKERMQLIELFNKGMIDALIAIRCLDEGVDIPSIRDALILSSNDDYREFVQRRGRILRKYTDPYTGCDKKIANIYDVIVCPSYENKAFAIIELRRFYEYMRLANNKDDFETKFMSLCTRYGIDIDELQMVDDSEDDIDE